MILIVDDEENILDLLEEYLGSFKGKIHRAASVPEALAHLQKNTYQLVISDIVLERGKGQSILTYIRKPGGVHEKTPVVLISGLVKDPGSLDQRTRFLAKPFNQEEFLSTIRELMGTKKEKDLHPELKKLLTKKT